MPGDAPPNIDSGIARIPVADKPPTLKDALTTHGDVEKAAAVAEGRPPDVSVAIINAVSALDTASNTGADVVPFPNAVAPAVEPETAVIDPNTADALAELQQTVETSSNPAATIEASAIPTSQPTAESVAPAVPTNKAEPTSIESAAPAHIPGQPYVPPQSPILDRMAKLAGTTTEEIAKTVVQPAPQANVEIPAGVEHVKYANPTLDAVTLDKDIAKANAKPRKKIFGIF